MAAPPINTEFKMITLYNHKGGVAKTSMTFHIGFELAKLGYNVIMVDGDAQMNLTQISMRTQVLRNNADGHETWDFEKFFDDDQGGPNAMPNNIYQALRPVTASMAKPIKAAKCFPLLVPLITADGTTLPGRASHGKLLLLAGHSELSEFEIQLTAAYRTNGNTDSLALGAFDDLLAKTATHYRADFVLVDSSPAKGTLNQHIVCMSDYLIVPTAADYFSYEGFRALAKYLPKWLMQKHHLLRLRGDATYAPEHVRANVALMRIPRHGVPKILGAVLSKFQMQNLVPIKNTQYWIQLIDDFLKTDFRDILSAVIVGEEAPKSMFHLAARYSQVASIAVDGEDGQPMWDTMLLIQMRDFGQLNSLSQQHCVPVTGLTMEQMTKYDDDGTCRNMVHVHGAKCFARVAEFKSSFEKLARNIVNLTQDAPVAPVHAGA